MPVDRQIDLNVFPPIKSETVDDGCLKLLGRQRMKQGKDIDDRLCPDVVDDLFPLLLNRNPAFREVYQTRQIDQQRVDRFAFKTGNQEVLFCIVKPFGIFVGFDRHAPLLKQSFEQKQDQSRDGSGNERVLIIKPDTEKRTQHACPVNERLQTDEADPIVLRIQSYFRYRT